MKKIAVLALSVLGGLLFLLFAFRWIGDNNDVKKLKEKDPATYELGLKFMSSDQLKLIEIGPKRANAGYAMIPLGLLAIVAGVMYSKLGKKSAIILLVSALVPAIFYPSSLIFGFLLLIAGGIGLVDKSSTASA